jgi:hypothetical protein
MNKIEFKQGDNIIYVGELNNWTFEIDIKTNDKGVIEKIIPKTKGLVYSVKFESGLIASIDSTDLKKID